LVGELPHQKMLLCKGWIAVGSGAISKAPPPASIGIEVYRGEVNGGEACKSKLCFCTCSSRKKFIDTRFTYEIEHTEWVPRVVIVPKENKKF